MEPVRVMIVDDQPVFLAGLRSLLDEDDRTEVVAEASSPGEAVERAALTRPDAVVMDLHGTAAADIPERRGLDATRAITRAHPRTGVLLITVGADQHTVFAAIRAGARGCLLRSAGHRELLNAVVAVGTGNVLFGSGVAQRLLDYFTALPPDGAASPRAHFPHLTSREHEILNLIAAGESNTVIAQRLFLAPKTVRNHVTSIFRKLDVADRAQAIVRARQAGLGTPALAGVAA